MSPSPSYGDIFIEHLDGDKIIEHQQFPVLGPLAAVLIVLGIVSLVGGIFAIQRRIWGMALAGAICALFPPPVIALGILAIVFVAMGKGEFK